jgi:pilus assembly protein CpaD
MLLLTGLGGCADGPPENGPQQIADISGRAYPIEIKSRLQTTPVVISETAGITAGEQAQLDTFIAEYLEAGGGTLSITASDKLDGRDRAIRRAERVASYAMHRGVRKHELDVRIGDTEGDQPVVLSFQRFSLQPAPCNPAGYPDSAHNPRNTLHPATGCATQANLAAMIANPADLAMPRGFAAADAPRRSLVIEAYRAGAVTDAARSPFANDFRLSAF